MYRSRHVTYKVTPPQQTSKSGYMVKYNGFWGCLGQHYSGIRLGMKFLSVRKQRAGYDGIDYHIRSCCSWNWRGHVGPTLRKLAAFPQSCQFSWRSFNLDRVTIRHMCFLNLGEFSTSTCYLLFGAGRCCNLSPFSYRRNFGSDSGNIWRVPSHIFKYIWRLTSLVGCFSVDDAFVPYDGVNVPN